MELVSIIMLVYNHEDYIEQAIISVLNQDYDSFELIILDDNSSDNSYKIAKEISEKHINGHKASIYSHVQNLGMINNLNFGLKNSKGKYIAICEGDDFWNCNKKIAIQVNEFENNPKASIVYHRVNVLKEGKTEFEILNTSKDKKVFKIEHLAQGNKIHTCSVMYKNENILLDEIYNNSPVGDYVLHLKYAAKGSIVYLPEVMSTYRIGTGIWSNLDEYERLRKWIKVLQLLISDSVFEPNIHKSLNNQLKNSKRKIKELNSFWRFFYRITDLIYIKMDKFKSE